MSFDPLLSPESPSYTFIESSISSLAALCSSIIAATIALIDSLAPQIPPSWCLVCKFKNRGHSHVHTETERTVPPSDSGTGSYILKKLEDTDGESTTLAIVFSPRTKTYSLKKLEDIDGEPTVQLVRNPSLISPTHHLPQWKKPSSATPSPPQRHRSNSTSPAKPNSSAKSSSATRRRAGPDDSSTSLRSSTASSSYRVVELQHERRRRQRAHTIRVMVTSSSLR